MYGGIHVQRALPFSEVHCEFSLHGDGEHGSMGSLSMLTGVHPVNASPPNPGKQLQNAECATTWHSAFAPHAFAHGFSQRSLTHALSYGQSLFSTHCGRQYGGLPI